METREVYDVNITTFPGEDLKWGGVVSCHAWYLKIKVVNVCLQKIKKS
jgi:hypothetical protein